MTALVFRQGKIIFGRLEHGGSGGVDLQAAAGVEGGGGIRERESARARECESDQPNCPLKRKSQLQSYNDGRRSDCTRA